MCKHLKRADKARFLFHVSLKLGLSLCTSPNLRLLFVNANVPMTVFCFSVICIIAKYLLLIAYDFVSLKKILTGNSCTNLFAKS